VFSLLIPSVKQFPRSTRRVHAGRSREEQARSISINSGLLCHLNVAGRTSHNGLSADPSRFPADQRECAPRTAPETSKTNASRCPTSSWRTLYKTFPPLRDTRPAARQQTPSKSARLPIPRLDRRQQSTESPFPSNLNFFSSFSSIELSVRKKNAQTEQGSHPQTPGNSNIASYISSSSCSLVPR